MGTRKIEAVEHTCDGCGKREYEIEGEPPMWIFITWTEISGGGGQGGKFEACRQVCAVKALKKRDAIEQQKEEEARR